MTLFSKTINRMQRNKEKGFTLIELMIVVAILGILAAIAIPNFMRFQAKSRQSEAKTNLGAIGTTAESYRAENDSYDVTPAAAAVTFDDLGWAPQGNTRYEYWYNGSVVAATAATGACDDSGTDPDAADSVSDGPPATFTTFAQGNIDNEGGCDLWSYTQNRVLLNDLNDVSIDA